MFHMCKIAWTTDDTDRTDLHGYISILLYT